MGRLRYVHTTALGQGAQARSSIPATANARNVNHRAKRTHPTVVYRRG